MKRRILFRAWPLAMIVLPIFFACSKQEAVVEPETISDAFKVSMPEAKGQIRGITLTDSQKGMVGASNSIALKALAGLYTGKSTIFSPLSLYLTLGMLATGAQGETCREIEAVLGGEINEVNVFSKSILEQLPALDKENTVIRLADAILLNNKYKISPTYKDLVEKNYYAPVARVSFSNPEEVLEMVNEWCNRQTEGLIPSILDKVDPSIIAYLMNALYFKSIWQDPFAGHQVAKYPFAGSLIDLDYLCLHKYLKYRDLGDYHIVSLNYSEGKYAFYILLPKEPADIRSMLPSLKNKRWTEIVSSMEAKEVLLRFPKFSTRSSFKLNEFLKTLGIQEMFKAKGGDFGLMFEDNYDLFACDVIQKATLSVDEYGTEAAAVTIVEMPGSAGPGESVPLDFFANRPFVFAIAEQSSDLILFSGIFDGK